MGTKKFLKLRAAGMILFMGLIGWGCTSDQLSLPDMDNGDVKPPQAYIGSEECAVCHSGIYNSFLTTGHPYMLSEVSGGTAPDYPFTQLDHLPDGYTWNDMSYVIGGYNWKANYVDADGYIVTGDDAQWNYETEAFAGFHPTEAPGTKMYDCGSCHTTGWVSVADGGDPTLDGMDGGFEFGGVQCEACHGQGAVHQWSRSGDHIVLDPSAAACGTCHSRDNSNQIKAMDGFIMNAQQHSELLAGAHGALNCVDCHNPHQTTKHGQMGGLVVSCTDCHEGINNRHKDRGADCMTCHMSYATKSAVERTIYQADIKTHIFKINTAADGQMFNEDGTIANGTDGVTLDLVCYQCHRDPQGQGGRPEYPFTSRRSMEQLSEYATGFHDE